MAVPTRKDFVNVDEQEVLQTLTGLGFEEADARTLADHFLDAESRGKTGHGLSRVEWLATRPFELDPTARPRRVLSEPGYERWDGNGALGYLTLAAIVEAQLADPPEHARLIVAQRTFPTGMLGYWGRKLAAGGLVAVLTATSPARLGHPPGGPTLTGTNQGPWAGVAPSGLAVSLEVLILFPWDPVTERFSGERIWFDRGSL